MALNRRQFLQFGAVAAATGLLQPALGEAAFAAGSDITHGSRSKPEVALTFHGAGDPAIAHSLLKILKATKVPVTVFAVGTWLQSSPEFAKLILDAGHDLGNHTLHHYQMKTLSAKQADSEIAGCSKILKSLVGNHGSWFRASGTQYTTATIRKAALKYGYSPCISYDVDSHDYQDVGKAAVIRNTTATIKNGSIVSLHFGHKDTVDALPTLIEQIHAKGLQPVTISTLVGK
jgi:peptidoglycan/xylan/chitin deacetylase (PgdA/CDA1 family)